MVEDTTKDTKTVERLRQAAVYRLQATGQDQELVRARPIRIVDTTQTSEKSEFVPAYNKSS